ncbi:MAG: hypothetical protein K2I57_01265, partial [Muribaculaceae bacterium]|nr:hypothetical protein [Muribaculaceae bacterium]
MKQRDLPRAVSFEVVYVDLRSKVENLNEIFLFLWLKSLFKELIKVSLSDFAGISWLTRLPIH